MNLFTGKIIRIFHNQIKNRNARSYGKMMCFLKIENDSDGKLIDITVFPDLYPMFEEMCKNDNISLYCKENNDYKQNSYIAASVISHTPGTIYDYDEGKSFQDKINDGDIFCTDGVWVDISRDDVITWIDDD